MPVDSSDDPSEAWRKAGPLREPKKRRLPAAFESIHVSREADEMIEAHRQAAFATGTAENKRHMDVAYSHLNVCAETLYTYIDKLESLVGIQRDVVKRF